MIKQSKPFRGGLWVRVSGGCCALAVILLASSVNADAQTYAFTAERAGAPADAGSGLHANLTLSSVACPTRSQCYAVGSYENSSVAQLPLIEQGSANDLLPAALALPSGAVSGQLRAVACSSATACVAVGSSQNSSDISSALLYVGTAGSWSLQTVPASGGNPVYDLVSVACSSSEAVGCVATDDFNYIVDEVASTWTSTPIPVPPAGGGNYDGLGCDANACTLVGYTYLGGDPGNYASLPITSTGVGSTWATRDALLPANANRKVVPGNSSNLSSISCSSKSCVAAGNYRETSQLESLGLFETITTNGTAPTTESPKVMPVPAGSSSPPVVYLQNESCVSASDCTAAGEFHTGSGWGSTIAVLSGGTVSETVVTGGGISGGQMSCTTAVCLMIDPGTAPLEGSGSSWAPVAPVTPSGGSSPNLVSDACVGTSHCVAVGFFSNAKGGTEPLVDVLT